MAGTWATLKSLCYKIKLVQPLTQQVLLKLMLPPLMIVVEIGLTRFGSLAYEILSQNSTANNLAGFENC